MFFEVDVLALKLGFVVDILAFFAWRLIGLLFEKLGNFFFKSSGHPACEWA
jgi:hypothetical protein